MKYLDALQVLIGHRHGQTGSIGAAECLSEEDCAENYREPLERLRKPVPSVLRVVATECKQVNIIGQESHSGLACVCTNEGGGSHYVGPLGGPCALQSRNGRSCLLDGQGFKGCTPQEPATCEGVCAELARLAQVDAARTFDVQLRTAKCTGGRCQVVYRVDDACLTNLDGAAHSCSLSDTDILAAAAAVRDRNQMQPSNQQTVPAPRYHPRSPDEWQGMLVDLNARPPCDVSERCGMALACIDERCSPCSHDSHCGEGEVCVLDHCAKAALVSCRSRRNCPSADLCILSGYTGGTPRGNEDMRAYCAGSGGSAMQRAM